MEDNKPLVVDEGAETKAEPKRQVLVQHSGKAHKMQKAQEKNFKKMMEGFRQRRSKFLKKQNDQLDLLKRQLGKEDFNALKSVCMVEVPEQKNEAGEVIEKAKTVLNKRALIVEAKHLLVLLREERIKNGKRKRTTGSTNDRRHHKAMLKFLTQRNTEASKELENTKAE